VNGFEVGCSTAMKLDDICLKLLFVGRIYRLHKSFAQAGIKNHHDEAQSQTMVF
jgi:hypothetical protein